MIQHYDLVQNGAKGRKTMRVSKKHDVRLNEILDAAQTLFVQKGYEKATVNDILERVEIGKGTFYHYFKSKEEVMNAVISRMVDDVVRVTTAIADNSSLDAHEKFKQIVAAVNLSESPNRGMIEELHDYSNAQMHQRGIVETIQAVAPIMAKVIEQGVREGIYEVEYPRETIEFLLAANQFMFDEGIIKWQPEELMVRAIAFVRMVERTLGASFGSFDFLLANINPHTDGGDAVEN